MSARRTLQGESWIAIPDAPPSLPRAPPVLATFTEFLLSLALWENQLFPDLTMHVDCFEFIHLVNTHTPDVAPIHLITVSDRSDDDGSMTFGWAIALPTGRRLAHCAGPAYGPYGSSFRAEGYGFLSVARFLIRIQEFCSIAITGTVKMLTDNQGLVTRLQTSLPFSDPFPNSTLMADWDVTNEIVTSLRGLSRLPLLLHVKGHQDASTEYSSLSLEAQLNVEADTEAGQYQCSHPALRPSVPRLQSNPVQLHLDGKVIPSRIKQRIREAYTTPPYYAHLATRYQWSPAVFTSIDWQAYKQTIGRFRTQRIQITKLCHDLLPTARWAHRYDSLTTEHCLHCGELEDQDHILRCPFPSPYQVAGLAPVSPPTGPRLRSIRPLLDRYPHRRHAFLASRPPVSSPSSPHLIPCSHRRTNRHRLAPSL